MPIEIRHDCREAPQITREQPGLRFTDANFSSESIACGIANIFDSYPRDGFTAWNGDLMVHVITGYLAIEEEGGETKEVCPGNTVHVPAGTFYRWRQMNDEDVKVFICNPLPFNRIERK